MRSGHGSSMNLQNESNLLLRHNNGGSKLPGSSNEQFPHENFDMAERYGEIEDILNNQDDLGQDFIANDLLQGSQEANNEFVQQDECFRATQKDYYTTQGTFHLNNVSSYQEISSIIIEDSKKRSQLMSQLRKGDDEKGMGFKDLLSKFKASNHTKKDKVTVFLSLLHLQRQNKVQLSQDNPESFSEIFINVE